MSAEAVYGDPKYAWLYKGIEIPERTQLWLTRSSKGSRYTLHIEDGLVSAFIDLDPQHYENAKDMVDWGFPALMLIFNEKRKMISPYTRFSDELGF